MSPEIEGVKIDEVLTIKQKTTERHLEEILKCRSWEEIQKHGRVEYHQTPNGPKEIWYFSDIKLLTVQLNPMDNGMDEQYKYLTEAERWALYPIEKAKIQNIGLSPKEYQLAIRKICDRLGI